MSTVFEALSDGFYTSFFEPESARRREKIETWINESVPVIQSAVENDLRTYLAGVLETTWSDNGWKNRAAKFLGTVRGLSRRNLDRPFIDVYRLYLEVKLRPHASRDEDISVGVLTPELRAKTHAAAEAAKGAVARLELPPPVALREIDLHAYNPEEALETARTFLKVCYRNNVRQVRVIHGKGTGGARRAVRDLLNGHDLVASFDYADSQHGGEGATEAVLVEYSVDNVE